MIDVISLYKDAENQALVEANGSLNYTLFNSISRLAELDVMDWATGDITGRQPPEPYITQKNLDLCAPFIKTEKLQVVNGSVPFPNEYYGLENLYLLGNYRSGNSDCEEGEEQEVNILKDANTPIEILTGAQFNVRCNTYIQGLQPSFTKPIAKVAGKTFEFMPKDLGSIGIQFYRYPVFAKITTVLDPVYNEEVPDPLTSTNYEWDEKTRGLLLWFIIDRFSNRISNKAQKEFNISSRNIRT